MLQGSSLGEPDRRLEQGFSELLGIMTNLDARAGIRIELFRMKIGETFYVLKSLPGMTGLTNKQQ